MGLARQLVALALLFTDRQQADGGSLASQRDARVRRAHDRELHQMGRAAPTLAPESSSTAGARRVGMIVAKRRSVEAGEQAERCVTCHHGCAGVAGAEDRVGRAIRAPLRPRPGSRLSVCVGAPPSAALPSRRAPAHAQSRDRCPSPPGDARARPRSRRRRRRAAIRPAGVERRPAPRRRRRRPLHRLRWHRWLCARQCAGYHGPPATGPRSSKPSRYASSTART